MANTITTLQNPVAPLALNGPNAVNGSKPAAPHTPELATPAAKSDRANLSSVGELVAKASAGSDVRTEKVAHLQQAIAAGTYHVPASAVAGKIVDSLLE